MKCSFTFILFLFLTFGIVACDDDSKPSNNNNNANNINNSNNTNNSTCGNGFVEGSESCDGTNLNGHDCINIDEGFLGGTLTCDSSCAFDVTRCSNVPQVCGNGFIEGSESCDGSNLNGHNCTNIGEDFTGGILACDSSCAFDVTNCNNTPDVCGDGAVTGSEVCDGTNFNGSTCEDLGHIGGTLGCNSSCDGFDESSCENAPVCGDGIVSDGTDSEVCDGANLNGHSCITEGYTGGTLVCNSSCSGFIESQCISTCGNGVIDGNEVCDGTNLNGESCTTMGYTGGVIYCNPLCTGFNMGECHNSGNVCGDGVIDSNEQCDGTVEYNNCSHYIMGTGVVTCNTNCTLNLSQCAEDLCANHGYYDDGWCDPCEIWGGIKDTNDCFDVCTISDGYCDGSYYSKYLGTTTCLGELGVEDPDCTVTCGDNVFEGEELLDQSCDGTNIYNWECTDMGFAGGVLACSDNCTWDTTNCDPGTCGDGIVVTGEECDGTELNALDCTDFSGYIGGTLGCDSSCQYDMTNCSALTCNAMNLGLFSPGNPITQSGNMCSGGGSDYYSPPSTYFSCTGSTADGVEKLFQITVNAGDTINIDWHTAYDNSLYLLTECTDTVAETCILGSDVIGSGLHENLSYTNSTGAPITIFIVGDIYDVSADCSTNINYTLVIN